SGSLESSLLSPGGKLTLEESTPGVEVFSGKKAVADIVRDIDHAQIESASGKLGPVGKRIEVKGKSATTSLEETLVLEVYDDFPSLALLSATYRNSGSQSVQLDSVALNRQQLNATLADPAAKSHEMYAFFGSSLKWGKDDVLPIPAKFSQENPF